MIASVDSGRRRPPRDQTRGEFLAPYPGSTPDKPGKTTAVAASLVSSRALYATFRTSLEVLRGSAGIPGDLVLDETAQRFQRLLERAVDHGSELVDAGRVEWFEGCAQSDGSGSGGQIQGRRSR